MSLRNGTINLVPGYLFLRLNSSFSIAFSVKILEVFNE
jgi:hypothetical protein